MLKSLIQIVFLFSITPVISQSLLTDPTNGCQYTLPWNCDECTVSWTGDCTDNLPNGKGTLTVFHDSTEIMKYEGGMKNGQFDGVGSYQDGMNKMDGYFKKNMLIPIDSTLYNQIEQHEISATDPANINTPYYGADNLYYYAIKPLAKPIGTMVLLPSLYENPESVLNSNSVLIKVAVENDLLVIVPTINSNFCLKQPSLDFLNEVFSDAISKYNCPEENFVIGGFSLGGMNSLRYTEFAFEFDNATRVKPVGVFAVDPPVDLVGLYNRELNQLAKDSTYAEAKTVLDALHEDIGTLEENYDQYVQYSDYSRAEKDGGNIKYLKDLPVRVYCDPDVNWWMENLNFSYYDINALDISAMILKLRELGNSDAEFINALGKGYRADGRRQPHSWSLIEPNECVEWILTLMK